VTVPGVILEHPHNFFFCLFFFFVGFKSKKIRVNLNLPIKAEVKAESADVLKTVDEDRKYVIQATIVRFVLPSSFHHQSTDDDNI